MEAFASIVARPQTSQWSVVCWSARCVLQELVVDKKVPSSSRSATIEATLELRCLSSMPDSVSDIPVYVFAMVELLPKSSNFSSSLSGEAHFLERFSIPIGIASVSIVRKRCEIPQSVDDGGATTRAILCVSEDTDKKCVSTAAAVDRHYGSPAMAIPLLITSTEESVSSLRFVADIWRGSASILLRSSSPTAVECDLVCETPKQFCESASMLMESLPDACKVSVNAACPRFLAALREAAAALGREVRAGIGSFGGSDPGDGALLQTNTERSLGVVMRAFGCYSGRACSYS